MSSKFVISLDFEMMWGVRDHRTARDYGDAVLGARDAIPKILNLFEKYKISATWATVGLLFAKNKDEIIEHIPEVQPNYKNSLLSPYNFILNNLGFNESDEPLYYGRSLLDRISDIEGQEIATHTFSHYYALEDGQTLDAFKADISSAISIGKSAGYNISSIVFPRNQMTDSHINICAEFGVNSFRGNQGGYLYRSRASKDNHLAIRGLRLLDGIVPIAGYKQVAITPLVDKPLDVTASCFLRPWSRKYQLYSELYLKKIKREIAITAKNGTTYHLWWHPHNMGRDIEKNLDQLEKVLLCYLKMKDKYGMQSYNMMGMNKITLNIR